MHGQHGQLGVPRHLCSIAKLGGKSLEFLIAHAFVTLADEVIVHQLLRSIV